MEKKKAVYNYMFGRMTAKYIESEFGVPESSLRKYAKEVKDCLQEDNTNNNELFSSDFSKMSLKLRQSTLH